MMIHVYAIVPNSPEVLTLGRSDYPQPQDNISRRSNLDGSLLMLEGLFTQDEINLLAANGTVMPTAEEARLYLAEYQNEWEVLDTGE